MKHKSLREWIEIYEKKRDEKVVLGKSGRLFYLAKRGFTILQPDLKNKTLIVRQMCGDGQFWIDFTELKAIENGLDKIAALTAHPIKAFLKDFGFEIVVEQNVNGAIGYLCQDVNGRKVTATPSSDKDYLVVLYVTEKLTSAEMFKPEESED